MSKPPAQERLGLEPTQPSQEMSKQNPFSGPPALGQGGVRGLCALLHGWLGGLHSPAGSWKVIYLLQPCLLLWSTCACDGVGPGVQAGLFHSLAG